MEQIEAGVNQAILGNYRLNIEHKTPAAGDCEGAMALFGEKYAEIGAQHHDRRAGDLFE